MAEAQWGEFPIVLTSILSLFGAAFLVLQCLRGCKQRRQKCKAAGPDEASEIENGQEECQLLNDENLTECEVVVHPAKDQLQLLHDSRSDSGFCSGSSVSDTGSRNVTNKSQSLPESLNQCKVHSDPINPIQLAQTDLFKSGNTENHTKDSTKDLWTKYSLGVEFIDAENGKKTPREESIEKLGFTEQTQGDNDKNDPSSKEGSVMASSVRDRLEASSCPKLDKDGDDVKSDSTSVKSCHSNIGHQRATSDVPATQVTVFSVSHFATSRESVDVLPGGIIVTRESDNEDGKHRTDNLESDVERLEELGSLAHEVTLKEPFEGGGEETEERRERCEESVEVGTSMSELTTVGGAIGRSPTPDFDKLGNISFMDQAELRFPSETHRGTVQRVAAQVQQSFETREVEDVQNEETLLAPTDEDKWVLLNADRKKDLDKVFKKLIKSMGRNVPDFIQSMFKSDKWWRIYINIDKGYVSQTWDFLKRQCSKYARDDLIHLVEQTSRPEFLSGRDIAGGMLLYALTKDVSLEGVLHDKNYFKSVKDSLPYATLGAIICGQKTPPSPKNFFGLTAMHLLTHEFKEGKATVDTVVVLPGQEHTDDEEVIHLGTEAHGIYGYRNKEDLDHCIDILLIPLREEILGHPALKKQLEVEDILPNGQLITTKLQVDVFKQPETEMYHQIVQKEGGITGLTHGEVKPLDNFVMVENNVPLHGFFVIASRDKHIRPFAIVGDSGSVVLIRLNEGRDSECMALGLVHKVQDTYEIENGEMLYNLTICVNLYNGLRAMEEMLHCKLEFCKVEQASIQGRGTELDISAVGPFATEMRRQVPESSVGDVGISSPSTR